MHRYRLVPLVLVLLFAVVSLASADINPLVNPGFETGNLNGWSSFPVNTGSASVVTSFTGVATYGPQAGNSFLALSQGSGAGITGEAWYQDVTLNAGDSLHGWIALDILQGAGDDTITGIQIEDAGGNYYYPVQMEALGGLSGSMSWQEWDWAPEAGMAGPFTLYYGIVNATGSATNQSTALFDADVFSSVPEPASCALLLGALAPLGLLRRRKRSAR